jgi:hypothetical protein
MTVRGQNLREILTHIGKAVGVAGASKHADAISSISDALADHDEDHVDAVVEHVAEKVASLTLPTWQRRLDEIKAAGISEAKFLSAFDALMLDKSLKKNDIVKIAEAYVGFVDKKHSVDRVLDSIKTRFYGKLYDHDANEMAKRATPW